jgi:hypothetical protein
MRTKYFVIGLLLVSVLSLTHIAVSPAQAPQQVGDDTFSPGFLVRDASAACVVRFKLTSEDLEARRILMRNVLEAAIEETNYWRRGYQLGGIDYADLRYFYLLNGGCRPVVEVILRLSQTPGLMRDPAGDEAGRALVTDVKQFGDWSPFRPELYFLKTRAPEAIRNCLVRFRIDNEPDLEGIGAFARYGAPIQETMWLMRFDFLDYEFGYRDVTLILSSHCAERERIMESFRWVIMAEQPHIDATQWQFDYSGDAYQYLLEKTESVRR